MAGDGPKKALPGAIRKKLNAARRRLGRVAVLAGIIQLAIFALGYHVGSFVLDRTLELPVAFRGVLLAVAAVALQVAADAAQDGRLFAG